MRSLLIALFCVCVARVPFTTLEESRLKGFEACEQKFEEAQHPGNTIYLVEEAVEDGFYLGVFTMPDKEEVAL